MIQRIWLISWKEICAVLGISTKEAARLGRRSVVPGVRWHGNRAYMLQEQKIKVLEWNGRREITAALGVTTRTLWEWVHRHTPSFPVTGWPAEARLDREDLMEWWINLPRRNPVTRARARIELAHGTESDQIVSPAMGGQSLTEAAAGLPPKRFKPRLW